MKAIFKIEYATQQFMSMGFRKFVEYHDRAGAAQMIRSINRRQSAVLISVTCRYMNDSQLDTAPIAKAIKRHEQKEVKRAFREAWQAVKEIEQAAREAHAANKEMEAMLNKIDYINFMAHHIVGNGIESNSRDMTREECEEWANKFFED